MGWSIAGNIRGPAGATGATGPTGATGSTPPLSSATPQPLGTAAAGTGTNASRDDHRHSSTVTTLTASGLTGIGAGRLVGAASAVGGGPPSSGTFLAGDWFPDLTNGGIWICTAGGSPGTWVNPTPFGMVGFAAPVTANQGSITTLVDLTGVAISYIPPGFGGRRYRVAAGGFGCSSTVANDTYQVALSVSGALVKQARYSCGPAVNNVSDSWLLEHEFTTAAASVAIKVQIQRATGSGTLTHSAGATDPAWMTLHDVGV